MLVLVLLLLVLCANVAVHYAWNEQHVLANILEETHTHTQF